MTPSAIQIGFEPSGLHRDIFLSQHVNNEGIFVNDCCFGDLSVSFLNVV